MSIDLESYVDVAERIGLFRERFPEGSLQQVSVDFRNFAGQDWVIFTAAAYRTPDDVRPGQGTAWEPVPGKTPYTRGSELQNAETAAWGRAIVAALAADTKRGVASRQEVRNRSAERHPQPDPERELKNQIWEASKAKDPDLSDADRQNWIRGELEANGNDLQGLLTEWEKAA